MNRYKKTLIILLGIILTLNALAFSKKICDLYTDTIYQWVSDRLGYISSYIPFCVGEIIMYFAIFLVLLAIASLVLFIFFRRKENYRNYMRVYGKILIMALDIIVLIYTLTWVIPFRATPIEVNAEIEKEYTIEDLLNLRKYVVSHMNEIADSVERDVNGNIIYPENVEEYANSAMRNISKEFPRMAGYYPRIKKAMCSDVLYWMNIAGYTYPYTMEVTYSRYIARIDYPTLYIHEMSHHNGYYRESDATFISVVACVKSDNLVLNYSGYRELLYYIDQEVNKLLLEPASATLVKQLWPDQIKFSDTVSRDYKAFYSELVDSYESNANKKAEKTYSNQAKKVADEGWSTQEELLKSTNYGGVVRLSLRYFTEY